MLDLKFTQAIALSFLKNTKENKQKGTLSIIIPLVMSSSEQFLFLILLIRRAFAGFNGNPNRKKCKICQLAFASNLLVLPDTHIFQNFVQPKL